MHYKQEQCVSLFFQTGKSYVGHFLVWIDFDRFFLGYFISDLLVWYHKRFRTMLMFAKHVVFHFIFDKNDTDIYIYLVFSREKSYIFSKELLEIRCLSSQ